MEEENQKSLSNRIEWVDVAKGYGMLCVIFAHLGVGIIGSWMYSFHLPLFFFLAGYVFHIKSDFFPFVKRKCRTMLIPYFSLGIPMVLFECVKSYLKGKFSLHFAVDLLFKLLLQIRFRTLWFIACLFFLNLFFYWIVKKLGSPCKIAIASAIMTVCGLAYYRLYGRSLPWNIDVCFTAAGFFGGGYIFKIYYLKIKAFFKTKYSILGFFAFGLINVASWYFNMRISDEVLEMFGSMYGFAPLTYLSAFAGIASVIIFSHWFTIKPVQYIGRNSMLYYAWHQTIMIPIASYMLEKVGMVCDNLSTMYEVIGYKLIELLLIILLLTACNWVLLNTKLKFMLGK